MSVQQGSPLRLWAVPRAPTPELQREINLVYRVLRVQAAGLLLMALLFLPGVAGVGWGATSVLLLSSLPVWVAMAAAHRGRIALAGWLSVSVATASTFASTLLFGGIRSTMAITLIFGPVVTGVIRGRWAAVGMGFAVLLGAFGIAVAEDLRLAPLVSPLRPDVSPFNAYSVVAVSLAMLVAMLTAYGRELELRSELAKAQAERALLSERRLADLVRGSPDGIVVANGAGVIQAANEAMARMTGLAETELLGKPLAGLLAPGSARALAARLEAAADGDEALLALQLQRRDGGLLPVEANRRRLTGSAGEGDLQLVIRDVSARVEAETKSRRLQEELLDARRVEGLGRLAGGLAHDLRNMLTPIRMNARVLGQSALPEGQGALLAEIEDAAERSTQLLNQLLAFARRQVLEVEAVDLNRQLEKLRPILSRLIRADIALEFEPGAEVPPVRADRTQLDQVIVNLVANARDAMPRGGRLLLRTSSETRRSPDGAGRLYTVLEVRDTGVGIPAEARAHLFEPFFSTKGDQGVGLGLATVHGIVAQSEGFIEVDSELGAGSTFRVSLPAWKGAVAPAEAAPKAAPAPASGRCVLVVDDQPLVRRSLARVLESAGYRVLEAGSAEQALALEPGSAIDALVTDLVLPGQSGTELAAALTARRPALKVLLVSGYDERTATSGVSPSFPFLSKPFLPDEVVEKVGRLFDPIAAPR